MGKPCQRCKGRGFIRQCEITLDEIKAGEPVTGTVTKVLDPEECPACGGSGEVD